MLYFAVKEHLRHKLISLQKRANMCVNYRSWGLVTLFRSGWYGLYVLLLLLLAYLFNQLDRYMLAITTKEIAQDIHYGDQACMVNSSLTTSKDVYCNATTRDGCQEIVTASGKHICEWNYNGQGFDYQLLVGPIFIVTYTFLGVPLSFAADSYNRKVLLAICLILWSVFTILTGMVQDYWQLALLRFGLGVGEAGCTPFAVSLIGDYFQEGLRATALGVYNWGIYLGYSMSYALGNFITNANIMGQSWRWSFYISGIPGVVLGFIILFTVKEPDRESKLQIQEDLQESATAKLKIIVKSFCKPSLMLLCLAGSIRNAAGYVWAYNTQVYYESLGQTAAQIGTYMSWIPLVAGSISVVFGGFISDRVVLKRGLTGRIIVIVVSLVLASPFTAGALWLPLPWGYLSLIPAYIIGEMWVGITLAIVIELVPRSIRTSAVAVYLFIISNIGGNIPLLVPPLQQTFQKYTGLNKIESLRASLMLLYPGEYILGALLYLLSLFVLRRDMEASQTGYVPIITNDDDEEDDDDAGDDTLS